MNQSHKQNICVVGSANYDQFLVIPHIPIEGETIQSEKTYIKNGGKGANQAVAAAKLGAKTIFTGQVGQDIYGQNIKNEMHNQGVCVEYLRQLKDVQTGQAIIMLDKKGENSIILIGGANIHYPDLNLLPKEYEQAIQQSRIIQLQKEIPTEINTLTAQYAKMHDKLIMLDCGGRDDPLPEKLLQNLDFISPNETELSRIIESPMKKDEHGEYKLDINQIRQNLLEKYPNLIIVLKLGAKGSAVVTKNIYVECPAVTIQNSQISKDYKIIDTTGAGDCFTSAFCVRYNELVDQAEQKFDDENTLIPIFQECLQFANAAGFLCITKIGAMSAQPCRKDVDHLIQKYLNKEE